MKPKSLLGRKVQLAFTAAIAIMLVVGAVSYRSMAASSESDRLVRHTHEVLENLQELHLAMVSIETSNRGFVLTGDESYVERYRTSALSAEQSEATLHNLTADNPEQQRKLSVLEALVAQRIQYVEMVIGLRRDDGFKAAVDTIRTGRGQRITDEFQSIVRQLRDEELRLLAQRDADAKERLSQSKTILILGTVLGLLIVPAAGWNVQRDNSRRELAEAALRASEDKLRMAVEAAEMGTWYWDIQRDEISWSEQFRTLFGLTSDAKLTYQAIIQVLHPDDRQQNDQCVKNTLELGIPYENEYRVVWPDSSVHWIAAKGRVHRNPQGVPVHMQGIVMDVTGRKEAQGALNHREALERRSVELKCSNEELQQFAYIAAHDLQEPLRMVSSFTQLLAKRYKGRLDSDADEFIAYAVDGAQRMRALIEDLLAYCRVGTNGKQLNDTSSETALEHALFNLESAIQESGGVVTHDPLPIVVADSTQLVQLFQNLVGNAIKYRGSELPLVHVSAKKNGAKEWIFSVKDNGLGIDPQYFEKIFVMFQRLHGQGEFSGTGIGLTVCKKIVERHGGRMWVESAPGNGSTFYFSLSEGVVK